MTLQEFQTAGRVLSGKAGVLDTLHGYFVQQAPRLHQTCQLFNLFDGGLGDVLEVGPFFGYVPFALRDKSTSYTVLEGDDPVVYPLSPLYAERSIRLQYLDLFEMFGPTLNASHRLNLPDASADTILCWETMEHFAFNPVKFVRELHRVLKPGGRACITVPNKASFYSFASLLTGKGQERAVAAYFEFENYQSNGKNAFYGFHWREYSPLELRSLFVTAGFKVRSCGTFSAYQDHGSIGLAHKAFRWLLSTAAKIAPRYGTNVFLCVEKV